MAKETFSLEVVARCQDGGDGGQTVHLYNTEEEMLADHHLAVDGKVSEEDKHKIITEDDPYDNGYIEYKTLTVTLEDGKLKLEDGAYMHFGQ